MGMFTRDPRPGVDTGPGRTKQSFRDDCDINVIVEKHAKTGFLNALQVPPPMYLDLASVPDYQTAANYMATSEQYFMTLPAQVRAEFQNDVSQFIDFLAQPDAHERLKDVGLAAIDEIADDPKLPEPEPVAGADAPVPAPDVPATDVNP